jgi:hypothetical protein
MEFEVDTQIVVSGWWAVVGGYGKGLSGHF